MSARSLLTTVVRRARRVQGYRSVRRAVLGRLRGSDTARDIVTRVFAGSQTGPTRVPQRFPAAGTLLAGVGVDVLPVTLVSLLDVPAERIETVVREVATCQVLYAGFRPVFVMCCPVLEAPRAFGYPVELLIEPEAWDFPEQTWLEYAAARFTEIEIRYGADRTVCVPPDGLGRGARVALARPGPR